MKRSSLLLRGPDNLLLTPNNPVTSLIVSQWDTSIVVSQTSGPHVPAIDTSSRVIAVNHVMACSAGLPSFPGHKRAAAQQDGFGAMLSFTVRGGEEAAKALALALRLITHATSLGGVESLLERRSNPVDTARGSPLNLLRLSVGLEHVEDIWDDLAQALEASQAGHSQQNGAH